MVGADRQSQPAASSSSIDGGPLAVHELSDSGGVGAVAADEAMVAELPAVAGADGWGCGLGVGPGGDGVEVFRLVAAGAAVEGAQKHLELIVAEAREREVEAGFGGEVCEQTGEQRFVPVAADAVEGEAEEAALVLVEVDEDDGHGGEAKAACGEESLVAGDDATVVGEGDERLDKAEGEERAGEGFEFGRCDRTGVGGVECEAVDGQLLDGGEGRGEGYAGSVLSY